MAKKPKIEIKSDKVEAAQKAACKDLYFSFLTIAQIAKKTGVKSNQIHRWIYGEAGQGEEDRDSWYFERSKTTDEEAREYRARNKYLTMILQSQAIEDTVNSMKLLRERRNKKGQLMPLTPFELERLTTNILNIQKINHVADMVLGNDEAAQLPAPKTIQENYDVIDMEAVAFAITKDKAIMKLIEGGLNERDFTDERKHSQSGNIEAEAKHAEANKLRAFRAAEKPIDRRTGSKAERRTRVSAQSEPSDAARGADTGESARNERSDGESQPRQSSDDSESRIEAARPEASRTDHQVPSGENRSSDSTERGDSEFGDTIRDLSEDGFADEYS